MIEVIVGIVAAGVVSYPFPIGVNVRPYRVSGLIGDAMIRRRSRVIGTFVGWRTVTRGRRRMASRTSLLRQSGQSHHQQTCKNQHELFHESPPRFSRELR
jgi:hypothetical protein